MKQGCRKKKKITNSLTPKIAVWPLNHTDIYNCWNQSTNSSFSLDLRKTPCQKSVRTTWLLITTPKRTQCFFKSRSHLVRPKDAVELAKQDGAVYRIPCECGKVYIGETVRPMQGKIQEHERDIRLVRRFRTR